jgi:hypothetical protein
MDKFAAMRRAFVDFLHKHCRGVGVDSSKKETL